MESSRLAVKKRLIGSNSFPQCVNLHEHVYFILVLIQCMHCSCFSLMYVFCPLCISTSLTLSLFVLSHRSLLMTMLSSRRRCPIWSYVLELWCVKLLTSAPTVSQPSRSVHRVNAVVTYCFHSASFNTV